MSTSEISAKCTYFQSLYILFSSFYTPTMQPYLIDHRIKINTKERTKGLKVTSSYDRRPTVLRPGNGTPGTGLFWT